MKNIVLYFPDLVNLRAFVVVEGLTGFVIHASRQELKGRLTKKQLAKAVTRYGAVLQQ